MKLFFVLALWGLAATESPTHRASTESMFIRDMFGVDGWDLNDIIVDHEEPVDGRHHYWDNDVRDPVNEYVIPEMCHLHSNNCTVYNSFILDCNSVEEFESVSEECRSFKCDDIHYFLEHGGDIYAKFLRAGSIKEAIELLHREMSAYFDDLNVCKCGKEFFQALFRAAPFYNGNWLAYSYQYNEEDMVKMQRVLRMLDFKALTKFTDRLMDGLCAETRSGRCLNSIFAGFEEIAEMVENTIADYEDYDDGDKKYKKKQEKRCDAFFGPMKTWGDSDVELDDGIDNGEDGWDNIFERTSAFMNSLYCDKSCKKDRKSGSLYPCCMQEMLQDKKLFKELEKFIVSVYRAVPATSLEYEGFAKLYHYFESDYDLEAIMAWTIPEKIKEEFFKTIHAAKYCPGRTMRCSNKPRPQA